ncbi:helicase-associated domain-containing protein [Chloroflexota bacterium]
MHSSQRFLVDYDMAMLRAVAENRDVELTTNRQTEAADQLAVALLEPLSVRVALARLSSKGREALDAILARGGRMRAPQFSRSFGQVRAIGPGRLEREAPWRDPASPAEELLYLGFMFRAFYQDEGGPGEFVFVPDDLLPMLPGPQHGPSVFSVETIGVPRHEGRRDGDGGALVFDLFAYLAYVQNHDVHPYADGRLGRRDLGSLQGRLTDPDTRRLAFLRHLAERLGFLALHDRTLRLEAAQVRQWLTQPLSSQVATLQRAWLDDSSWNDLCRVPSLQCDPQTDWHQRHNPVAPRFALLALLARCPRDAWWLAASFVASVKEAHPDFQRPDGDYTSWYIRDVDTGAYLSGFEAWEQVEGAYVADLLVGVLKWLGVVESAGTGVLESGDLVCRLTEAGLRLLDLLPDGPESPPPLSVSVGADFRVTVPEPVNLYTRFQLERFAVIESTNPCGYRLTAGSIMEALSRGIQIEQVLAFLQQASEGPLPANVVGQLRLWAGRFGQVALEEVALLTVKEERVLKELSVLPETRSLIDTMLSPTVALVLKRDLPRLHRELRALGYLAPLPADSMDDRAKRG